MYCDSEAQGTMGARMGTGGGWSEGQWRLIRGGDVCAKDGNSKLKRVKGIWWRGQAIKDSMC